MCPLYHALSPRLVTIHISPKNITQGFTFASSWEMIQLFKNNIFHLIIPFYFIYLAVLGLSCGMWDLVPPSDLKPRACASGGQSLSHWTTREVPDAILNSMNSLKLRITVHSCKWLFYYPNSNCSLLCLKGIG